MWFPFKTTQTNSLLRATWPLVKLRHICLPLWKRSPFLLAGGQAEVQPQSLTCRLLLAKGIPVPELQEAHAKLSEWVSGRHSHLAWDEERCSSYFPGSGDRTQPTNRLSKKFSLTTLQLSLL